MRRGWYAICSNLRPWTAPGPGRTFARRSLRLLSEAIATCLRMAGSLGRHHCRSGARSSWLDASPTLLRIALENVLRNALFYTPAETEVTVTLTRAGDGALVVIRDYGPGVPEFALPHLFDPFFRVDESRTRHTGGTGIGLAIVERVVTLHGGVVSAQNVLPSGLRVTIELPALPAELDPATIIIGSAPAASPTA